MATGPDALILTSLMAGLAHTLLGPCEPLIPIMMYPALQQNISGSFLATGLFGAATILTMLAVVTA